MKKALMSLITAICLSCAGQQVITNYIYEVREYTNNIWTVSNVTIVTHNEITQNVNRVYNYYSTNFTINVETNLYIDTLIGTNIATNVEMTVNVTTNLTLYQTNFIDNVYREVTYHTTYETNVNTYIDTWQNVYQTNYTTEVTLTNFEGYVEQCETIISNGVDYISSLTNNVGDAMLYAYIASEAMRSLGNTNGTYIATNEFVYSDINGIQYSNMTNLTLNNVNGDLVGRHTTPYDYPSGQNHYSTSYSIRMNPSESPSCFLTFHISHASKSDDGMKIFYLPSDQIPLSGQWSHIIPICLYWNANNLILHFYNSYQGIYYVNAVSNISRYAAWPNGIYSSFNSINDGVTMSGPRFSGISNPILKTSYGTPSTSDRNAIFVSCSPSLSDYQLMWKITNLTGFQYFR